MNPDQTLTVERVKHYLSITEKARDKATPLASTPEQKLMLKTLLSMADDYAHDAQYFLKQGDLIRAFGAINYAYSMDTVTMYCSRYLKRMASSLFNIAYHIMHCISLKKNLFCSFPRFVNEW